MNVRNPFAHPDNWLPDEEDIPTCSECGVAIDSGSRCRDCDICPDCGSRLCPNRDEDMCPSLDGRAGR